MSSPSSSYYFVIVGHSDQVVYEIELGGGSSGQTTTDNRHLNQFIAHAALDLVDEAMWRNTTTYLKQVDKFNEWIVSAYVTAGGLRFLFLYEHLPRSGEDGLKNFLTEVYETYVKLLLNPFYVPDTPIRSAAFDKKIQTIARKWNL
ncbi:unnamed protein product [Rotaria socialis]|uniref:Trafficking protein particle complex subunit 2 n=1 Tax=Rotaria socialis TaxID=392032 RepID=A0A821A8B6_9BILA|nr:unnamed protein product [Rotaria socialis]CAF3171095.1 unnamed protein product [Rotaria socialis]CAF3438529.1 unnamed protein product [Rotaria socialis]CAF3466769.1 unnamed protein product [Rotaria socialis]CAF3750447.1 unnamed protein product [Rotaria socialis]